MLLLHLPLPVDHSKLLLFKSLRDFLTVDLDIRISLAVLLRWKYLAYLLSRSMVCMLSVFHLGQSYLVLVCHHLFHNADWKWSAERVVSL